MKLNIIFIREHDGSQDDKGRFIHSGEQIADIFTKSCLLFMFSDHV